MSKGAEEIKLGMRVKDKVTGFEGIVDHIAYYPYMCNQVCIKPTKIKKDGGTQDGEMFDLPQVEIVNKKPIYEVPELPEQRFEFGQKVKDSITGFTGKINGRAVYMNGCSRVLILPEFDPSLRDTSRGLWTPENQVDAVGKVLTTNKKKEAAPRAGGPSAKKIMSYASSNSKL